MKKKKNYSSGVNFVKLHTYKEKRMCRECGRMFEVKHQLRQYCDKCKYKPKKIK